MALISAALSAVSTGSPARSAKAAAIACVFIFAVTAGQNLTSPTPMHSAAKVSINSGSNSGGNASACIPNSESWGAKCPGANMAG